MTAPFVAVVAEPNTPVFEVISVKAALSSQVVMRRNNDDTEKLAVTAVIAVAGTPLNVAMLWPLLVSSTCVVLE